MMARPGQHIRSIALRLLGREVVARWLDPTIADLRHEHAEAVAAHESWSRRRILVCGYLAIWKVLVISVVAPPPGEWTRAERTLVWRTVATSAAVAVLVAGLFAGRPLYEQGLRLGFEPLLLLLVPQSVPLALPIGLAAGLGLRLRSARVTWRVMRPLVAVAFACVIVSFGFMGWVIPRANLAFRTATRAMLAPHLANEPMPRSRTELTLNELRDATIAKGDGRRANAQYQVVTALPWATLVVAAFVLAAMRRFKGRRWLLAAVVWSACPLYYVLLLCSDALRIHQDVPSSVLWLPNVTMAVAAFCFLATRHRAGPEPPLGV